MKDDTHQEEQLVSSGGPLWTFGHGVRKILLIRDRRHASSADDGIKLFFCFSGWDIMASMNQFIAAAL